MIKQSNIRHLIKAVSLLILVTTALSLTATGVFGRFRTKVDNLVRITASSAPNLYVIIPPPLVIEPEESVEPEISDTDQSEAEDIDPTESEQPDNVDPTEQEPTIPEPVEPIEPAEPEILKFEREQLFSSSDWITKGGEQYITFTVANSYNSEIPEKDISFRVRVVLPESETEEENNYTLLSFSLEANGNTYNSRIGTVSSNIAFHKKNKIDGSMYRFIENLNEEPQYTLKANNYDSITFTLSLEKDIEFDCSKILIYIDRVN